jgi:hypothetical protein
VINLGLSRIFGAARPCEPAAMQLQFLDLELLQVGVEAAHQSPVDSKVAFVAGRVY